MAEPFLEPFLRAVHERIEITWPENQEARHRAAILEAALARGFQAPVYLSGSVVHGDALTPLNDVDLGVIVHESAASTEWLDNPSMAMEYASLVIKSELGGQFPNLGVSFVGQKRSVVVRFDGPQQGVVADVIVALNPGVGEGIMVPNLETMRWDRSDPLRHNKMMHQVNEATKGTLNEVVRLFKAWSRANGRPVSSWNIKALALTCVTQPMSLTHGVASLFHYAARALARGRTRDPAGVSTPIRYERPKVQVVSIVRSARDAFDEVVSAAAHRSLSLQGNLSKFFGLPCDLFQDLHRPMMRASSGHS